MTISPSPLKTAIIGTGISGLSAAYALFHAGHEIAVYEKNAYLGGHSRTIEVEMEQAGTPARIPVDTGFIVLNDRNYPNLNALFAHLGVRIEKSDMSFGVDINQGWLQYSSKNIFKRWQNISRPSYWRMLVDIMRFNATAKTYLNAPESVSIRQCLDEMKMGVWFRDYYLQAMGAAIWSCPISTIEKFPAKTFIRFFENHGLLTVNDHPQWYTVSGGSREYVAKLSAPFQDKIKLNCGVKQVRRENGKVFIEDESGNMSEFDHVIFACHADQALKMLAEPSAGEREVLGGFSYQENKIVVHSDKNFMPDDESCWASWIYLCEGIEDKNPSVALSYWMNNLQNFKTDKPLLVTLNPTKSPDSGEILDTHYFRHPVFDKASVGAQAKMKDIQGTQGAWYVGAYQRYGFHEDGILSSVWALEDMGVEIPWKG